MSATAKLPRQKLYLSPIGTLELRKAAPGDPALPAGVCGQCTAKILTYGVLDLEGTVFQPGCLDRTKNEKVKSGKVQVFLDHKHDTDHHCGVVRSLDTVGNAEIASIDLLDTPAGRQAKGYMESCQKGGAFAGWSVGVIPRNGDMKKVTASGAVVDMQDRDAGEYAFAITEAEMMECSITPLPAVPGTQTIALRSDREKADLLERTADAILIAIGPARAAQLIARYTASVAVAAPAAAGPSTSDVARDALGSPPADSGAGTPTRASLADRTESYRRSLRTRLQTASS